MVAPSVALANICRVQSGYAFKSSDWQTYGVPVVQIGNVKPRHLDLSSTKFVSERIAETAKRFQLNKGDILISMTGHIGLVARVVGDRPLLLNQRVGRFEDIDEDAVDPDFLFEVLQSAEIRSRFVQLGYGAAQPNISPKLIGSVEIPLPPIEHQRRVAGVLRSYDDLIEVNRRRIALLEEMACALFEEWFVRFRFPGRETIPITETPHGPLPAGWEFSRLAEIARIKSGEPLTKAAYRDSGVLAYSASGPDGFVEKSAASGAAVVVSAVGAYCGRTWLAEGEWTAISNTFYVQPTSFVPASFLYFSTLGREKWPKRGSAQPFIARGDAAALNIPTPPKELLEQFSRTVDPIMAAIRVYWRANARLAQARDLLLPRLINGDLSIAAAERAAEDAAASADLEAAE